MTVLFAGGEMGAFVPSDSGPIEGYTGSDEFTAGFARCATTVNGPAYVESSPFPSLGQDIWVHFETSRGVGSEGSTVRILEVIDNAAVPVFKVEATPSSSQMYRWDGAAYQAIGAAVAVDTSNVKQTFDIHILGNTASGSASMYVGGTLRTTGSADTSAVDDMQKVRHYGRGAVSVQDYSQTLVTTGESTIGDRLMTVPATGAGATLQMTGSYTAIDEIAYSDTDFIWSDTANQVELFSCTPTGSLAGYTVRGVTVTARANTDGTGPAHIQMALRTGGTTYFSGNLTLDAGMGAFHYTWETNPNTTLPWTAAEAAAIQFGVKSIA
jgi:hypothetical protein